MSIDAGDIAFNELLEEEAYEEEANRRAAERLTEISNDEDLKYLRRILKDGESFKVEVKLSIDGVKDNIAKAICALANQKGGKAVVGLAELKFYKPEMGRYSQRDIIDSDFIAMGVKNADKARIDLSSHLRANTNLGTSLDELYTIRELSVNQKKILLIKVKPYFVDTNKLILYKNEMYRRIDNQTVRLTMSDLVSILNSKGAAGVLSANTREILSTADESKDLIYDAIPLVIQSQKASISFLQRRLRIGYSRSARLIDRLEKAKVIAAAEGSMPRRVLVGNVEEAEKLLKIEEQS